MDDKISMKDAVEALADGLATTITVTIIALHRQTGVSLEAIQQELLSLQPQGQTPVQAALTRKFLGAVAASLLQNTGRSGRA